MSDWNVSLYQKFTKDRQQPVYDLIHRIESDHITTILDVGCGSGMSTLPLKEAYPNATITGIDYSENMLASAREKDATITWKQWNCNYSFREFGKFDLVFSNAALQWLTNQAASLEYMAEVVAPNGTLAIQIPLFQQLPIEECIRKVVTCYPAELFQEVTQNPCVCYTPEYYYNEIIKHFSKVHMWKTEYYQIMDSPKDIVEFYRSTGLRPYLNLLNETKEKEFLERILIEVQKKYPVQSNGKVLFEFSRLFIVANQ
ncbi:MAG: methyltransferase domain-containing protein [Clostridiales bacterium]|nr:methyltransferase domain-containing protein [Clostridiales bacterium]